MKLAIVGAGQRGTLYASYISKYHSDKVEFAAVVEPNSARREAAVRQFNIERAYHDLEDFLAEGRIADAVIVATMDQDHFGHAMKLLDLKYDLLLEKPISPDSEQCLRLQQKADAMGCEIIVCHVLRYTSFFSKIKELVDSGELGRIVTIEYAEYMGNFHMAHSFVRGKWRNLAESCNIFLQKSCHDMDILVWLTGSQAVSVSSMGGLSYFREENAPEGSADRCSRCSVRKDCRFDAERVYMPMIGQWRAVDVTDDMTESGMRKAIEEGPYGRCVYRCDNDVCDHQTASILFRNGVTATFQMSGFSDKIHRRIKVMCEHGSIEGDDSENFLTLEKYGSFAEVPTGQIKIELDSYIGRHGGGDYGIAMDFVSRIQALGEDGGSNRGSHRGESVSAISKSIESHLIANAAEESRLTGRTVYMDEYLNKIKEKTFE